MEDAAGALASWAPAVREVAVVGASGVIGAAVVRALAALPGIERVVAVHDAGAPDAPDAEGPASARSPRAPVRSGVVHDRAVDVASPSVLMALDGVQAVVYVALETDLAAALDRDPQHRRARALAGAQAVTTATAAVGAPQLVAVTSAAVLGASAHAPLPLADGAPLLAVPDDGLVGDLLAVEEVLERAESAHPGTRVAILRPAALVGAGIDTVTTRHFGAPRLLTLRESPPVWQFCALEDLVSSVLVALTGGLAGPFGVGSAGFLTQTEVEEATGMRRVELSARQARATAERLARAGVLLTPATDLAQVVHPPVVDAAGLRAAGWAPVSSNAQCLAQLAELVVRRPGETLAGAGTLGGVATAGAAGAAVALVATAALVRQARVRRRGRA